MLDINYDLHATLSFTGDLEKARSNIESAIYAAEQDIFRKTLPGYATGAHTVSYEVYGKTLDLSISSDRPLKSHVALLRLRKPLVEAIGDYRIGLRDMILSETIEVPVEKKPLRRIRIPFTRRVTYIPERSVVQVEIKNITSSFLEDGSIDRLEKLVHEKIEEQYQEGKPEQRAVIWQSSEKPIKYSKNPTTELMKLGWIKQGPGPGQWFYGPQMTALIRNLEKLAVQEALNPLGFKEVMSPKVTPFSIWEKTGHLSGSEPEMYFVSLPKSRDKKDWQRIIDMYKITKKAPVKEIRRMLKDPLGGNCYAQCPPMYWAFEKTIISNESLPVLMFDKSGVSNRNEAGGRIGFERVNEFHRIEPVYIGKPEQVTQVKKALLDKYTFLFNDILDLEWRYVDVIPFYLQQAGIAAKETSDELWKGTLDFEAYMPYRGDRKTSEWLEFQNLSVLGNKYTKVFSIKSQKGELWSGCSGIGLERWAAAFLAQHGINKTDWPQQFIDHMYDISGW